MSLPRITEYPTKTVELPISKLKVKYRGFIVKEEKKLLMLKDSDADSSEVLTAMSEIIAACTFNKVDATKISMVDLEFLFLRIRAISKGETTELGYKCNKPDEDGKVCGTLVTVNVNLEKIVPKFNEEGLVTSFFVEGTDPKIGMHFRLPTLELAFLLQAHEDKVQRKLNKAEEFDIMIGHCLQSVTVGEEMISEFTLDDLTGFFNTVPAVVFDRIRDEFYDRMPKLAEDVEFVCPKCAHHQTLHLEGSKDFF